MSASDLQNRRHAPIFVDQNTGDAIDMNMTLAAFNPMVSLREVMSHACIHLPVRPVVVYP